MLKMLGLLLLLEGQDSLEAARGCVVLLVFAFLGKEILIQHAQVGREGRREDGVNLGSCQSRH